MKPETKLKRILAKKRLTGKDIGEVLLLDIAVNLKRRSKGEPPTPPSLTPEDIDGLATSLTDKEKLDYNTYVSLHNVIANGATNEGLYSSQFFHAYYKLQNYLTDILNFEEQYSSIGSRPLIIVDTAYNKLLERARAARAAKELSYADILFYTADYFILLEQQPILLPPSIRSELEALKGITIEPPKLPAEPLKPAKEDSEKAIDAARLIYEGKEAIIKYLDSVNYDTEPLKELTENELIDHIGELGAHSFFSDAAYLLKKRAAESYPEGATKHDLLRKHIRAYYAAKEKEVKQARLKAFKSEFSALYKAIDAYMCMQIPELAGVKANQQLKTLYKASDLAGVIANYEPIKVLVINGELTTKDIMNLFDDTKPAEFLKRAQIGNGGISVTNIITPSAISRFDDSGVYAADINRLNPNCIDTLQDSDSGTLDDIIFQQEWLIAPIRKIIAYNTYLKAAFKGLNITYLEDTLIDTHNIEFAVNCYNNAVYLAYSGAVGTPKERADRRAAIKRAFKPLNLTELQPTQEIEEQLDDLVNSLKADDALINFFHSVTNITKQIASLIEQKGGGLDE